MKIFDFYLCDITVFSIVKLLKAKVFLSVKQTKTFVAFVVEFFPSV